MCRVGSKEDLSGEYMAGKMIGQSRPLLAQSVNYRSSHHPTGRVVQLVPSGLLDWWTNLCFTKSGLVKDAAELLYFADLWVIGTSLVWTGGQDEAGSFSLGLLEEEKRALFLTANVGEYAVFNCQLDFPNDIEIPYKLRWKKEGMVVFSWYKNEEPRATPDYQGRINLLPHDSPYGRGSINLTSIRESDGGWYECSVFFPNRSPSTRPNGTWYHLTVDGGTLLAIPPINQTTLEGEPAHFPCVTKDRDGRVTWYKDGVPLSELPDLEERSTVSQEGSLTIQETDIDDPGEYHCVVTNSLGERQTAGAFLNVLYKAKALSAPREVYLPFGKPGVLDCNFRANPPLTNLRWDKNGFLYDPYNVQGVFYSRNGSLFFSKVEEIHSGHYTCTPFNDLGTEGPSAAMKVIVQKAPVFTITPNNLYLKKLGDTLEMPCDAVDGTKDHRPTIVWFKKDGTPLPLDRIMIQNGNLTIERIQQSDDGMYSCVASNEVATITADTEVAIETTSPRAPYNLTASASHSSVTLRWMAGTGRANTEFHIWYRPADAPEWRTMKILTRGVTQATVNSLDPGRIYEFMVLSQDKKGDGMFSKAIQIRTRGSDQGENVTSAQQYHSPLGSFQQIGPPRNVSVSPSRDGYLVTWEPPDLGMEDLLNYHVRWSQEGKEHLHGQAEVTTNRYLDIVGPIDRLYGTLCRLRMVREAFIQGTAELKLLMTTLSEDTTYHFQVIAWSNRGYQASSNQFVLRVPGYRSIRAVALGVVVGLAVLVMAAAGSLYVRRLYLKRRDKDKEETSS
uniref:Uncharacterized protein n=1 Tax=Timema douglasi TaxID=61478 RepID=A0A7R8Z9Y0_TIMDO|nr:unnamed protein product [Timema douglasi]